MLPLAELPTPALLLDLDVLERNLARMARRAKALGVALRPHIKTHKCIEIARLQRELGARGLTVSTLEEARVFADAGFDDLTWAFPIAPSRVPEVVALASRVRLGVTVDSIEAVRVLADTGASLHVWIEVDSGQHRAGVDPESEVALEIGRAVHESSTLRLDGVLTHAGQSYACRRGEGLADVAETERERAVYLADRLRDVGVSVEQVSVGSTPTMSAVRDLTGVTEMRPGNYVFYDYTQMVIGASTLADCAVTVLSTVISVAKGAGRAVIDAGALALSKDGSPSEVPPTMGRILSDDGASLRDDVHARALSQEHGMLEGELAQHARVRVLPNHACLTVACFDRYHVLRAGRVVDVWPIHRAR